ncbi:hypothetical protein GTO87_05900 [Ligilactobacillus saerimneri]|uniref:Uncharacterized protein n=1 Tax=Ligilactobacillus saerimneri TaxID=228229 RepID=A0A7H9EKH8_9LACO|nr:hypothetical protein [Ligilactobacillus saerimneri]QLL78174.1 hypothetical protein GTO87_05900 [Ligilactobacillus saerimneri]
MAQSGVNKSTKKDPVVKSNEINTFNQPNYNTELVALKANKLAKKYSNLLVTNGPEGRKSANKAKNEIAKFIKKNKTDFKEKKKQAMDIIKAMNNQLDEALAPAVEVHDELDELIKESQNAQHEAQDAENRQIAHEMAKNLGVAPGLVDKIIDYKNKALYPLGTGKLKRERYINSKLRYALEHGFIMTSDDKTEITTKDAQTGETISKIKTVSIKLKGDPFVIDLAIDTLKEKWKELEVDYL